MDGLMYINNKNKITLTLQNRPCGWKRFLLFVTHFSRTITTYNNKLLLTICDPGDGEFWSSSCRRQWVLRWRECRRPG